jgi:hypothetical protein
VRRRRPPWARVEGLGSYSAAGQHRPAPVIGYGRPPEHAFTTALARLCAALAGHQSV